MKAILDLSLAGAIFGCATLVLVYISLVRYLHQSRELKQLQWEAQGAPCDASVHPVLRALYQSVGDPHAARSILVEEACHRFFEPRIRTGDHMRNVALSGSFALTLIGFILSTAQNDTSDMVRHVAPYFAFSLVGVLLGIAESGFLLLWTGQYQAALLLGQRALILNQY